MLTCSQCYDAMEVEREKQRKAKRIEIWKKMCPLIYQETDPDHHNMPKKELLSRIIGWQYGPKGMLIRGPTGCGKTRSVWLLLRRLIMEERSVVAMSSNQFARECARMAMVGPEESIPWFNRLTRVSLLVIDDFGKAKNTERFEADLFEVIDVRFCNHRPVILTTNMAGDDVAEAMSLDRGTPLIRRLLEFCEDVAL